MFLPEHVEDHAGGPYKWWTLTDLHHYWGRPPPFRWMPLWWRVCGRIGRGKRLSASPAVGQAWSDEGYVFTDELGAPLHPEHYSTRFGTLVDLAGLRRIRLHDTRHTAASLMLASGENVKVVAGTARALLPLHHPDDLPARDAGHVRGRRREAERGAARLKAVYGTT